MNRTSCPDAARLAAFLDGRLPEAERALVLRHLDECEDCLEWVCEAGRVGSAEAADGSAPDLEERRVRPPQRTGGRWIWVGAAAAALLAAVFLWRGLPEGRIGELARMIDPLAEAFQPLPVYPGSLTAPGFAPSNPAQADFLLGVAMVDLYAAAREGRSSEIERLGGQVRSLLAAIGGEPGELASSLEGSPSGPQVLIVDGALEEAAGSDYLQGRWAETLRLAAETQNLDYLMSPVTQALLSDAETGFPEPVREALQRLRSASDGLERSDRMSALKRELSDWIESRRAG